MPELEDDAPRGNAAVAILRQVLELAESSATRAAAEKARAEGQLARARTEVRELREALAKLEGQGGDSHGG